MAQKNFLYGPCRSTTCELDANISKKSFQTSETLATTGQHLHMAQRTGVEGLCSI